MNLSVFASGRGSNFLAIAKAVKSGRLKANLVLLVCDNPRALVLEKAKKLKVKSVLVERRNFVNKSEFEAKIISALKQEKAELIVMAGYMRMLSADFVRKYRNRIINVHPSLLPSFKGASGIKDAFSYGVKVTGVTVHLVDEEMDHGPIILQKTVEIKETDTLATLENRIHQAEHDLYPQAIKLILQGKVKLSGRKTRLKV